MSSAEKFYIGVKALICTNDACLLLKRVKPERVYWDLPGGRMGDETLRETLDREIKEEVIGLPQYIVEKMLDVYPLVQRVPDGTKLLFVVFKVMVEPFTPSLSSEHTEAVWVTKEGLAQIPREELEPHFELVRKTLDELR